MKGNKLNPKNNMLARKATKHLGDHYARMFAQIATQEGIYDIHDLCDFICNMSVDDFCDYKFSDVKQLPADEEGTDG